MGVQSFIEKEANAAGRPQRTADVLAALEHIRTTNFPTLNLDLMYGLPGQTVESWLASLRIALTYAPQELYLYPLYVRPLTGLGQKPRAWDDFRLACYRAGRDFLHANGWRQLSLRMFLAPDAPASTGPLYCCQDDGMVGLGCGARSYTRTLHYANEYAVGARDVREIIGHFLRQKDFSAADYGFILDADEQGRRYLIKSLLRVEGLNVAAYRTRFTSNADADFPALRTLRDEGLATFSADAICLTAEGLELSDAIGPALYSRDAQTRINDYELS
jgi:oxygen-independent coproporphyrinogen-3 oxidase